ncbi:MAG: aminotransferase class III-fold pyridoxal phosphate-dependent enzyme, partial [Pyrinomonadaceae bacterium]|nr:aminotransferase class III-fold pyridoxal phosphate-dependent enzyme [Sphingobacteriaceae bacterium]
LIYDEVQTGVGLSGKFWCHEHFGENARPDIIAFGKKMQVCGILAGGKVDEIKTNVFNVPSRLNSTWGGNLTDMVRSSKILQIINEDKLVQNASKAGEYLQNKLLEISQKYPQVSNVRGYGMLAAFDLPNSASRDKFIAKGLEYNVLFLGCGSSTIRFRPALIMTNDDIDSGIEVMHRILQVL